MSGSGHLLKVSQELVRTYTQRRNGHLGAAMTGEEQDAEADPYAFVEGDEEFSFSGKKDKAGGEREVGEKHKVGGIG